MKKLQMLKLMMMKTNLQKLKIASVFDVIGICECDFAIFVVCENHQKRLKLKINKHSIKTG